MAETFDFATTNPGAGGTNLAGDTIVQSSVNKFIPACYLVFGDQDGPYTRVSAADGFPVTLETDLALSLTQIEENTSQLPGRLGQTISAGSFPVVIAKDQTPIAVKGQLVANQGVGLGTAQAWKTDGSGVTQPVSGTFWQTTQPVSGTFWQTTQPISITPAQTVIVTQTTGVNLHVLVDSGSVTADTELPAAAALADATSNPTIPSVGACEEWFNGTSWDRVYNNTPITLFSSAARNATVATSNQRNRNGKGLWLVLSVTAAGTGNLKVFAYGYDQVSTGSNLLNAGVAVTTTGRYVYQFYPGMSTTVPGGSSAIVESANILLPETWSGTVVHSDGSSWTYSLSAVVMM